MAGDWIKMRVGLWTHPKVVTLASRLSVTKAHAVGALFAAWCIADQHADENGLVQMTPDALDSLCETPGLACQMEFVGWVYAGETSLQFVEYQEHNGTTGKIRANDAKRQRLSRSRHNNVTSKRDDNVTREEKRREENTNTPHTPQGGSNGVHRTKKVTHETDPSFARFWDSYPRKSGKKKAAAAFAKIAPSEQLLESILAALESHKKSAQWVKDRGEYIPHPATWLNQQRWEDEGVATVLGPSGRDAEIEAAIGRELESVP